MHVTKLSLSRMVYDTPQHVASVAGVGPLDLSN